MDRLWTLINDWAEYLLFFQGILIGAALTIIGYAVINESSTYTALIFVSVYLVVTSFRAMAERHKQGQAQSTQE